jgi:peptidoglycan/LPS O-acetylase OafA/YrhL
VRSVSAWTLSDGPGRRLSRVNNFDSLRLLAALAVVVSHSFAIAGAAQPSIGGEQLGRVGVHAFFAISGFLIAQSWTVDPHLGRFFVKRCLRIFPALIVMLLLTTLVLGPALTVFSAGDYWGAGDTWMFLLRNSVFATAHELPGVFLDTPTAREVNAPIHTLQSEVLAYLAIAGLGIVGALARKWTVPAIAVLLFMAPHQSVVPYPGTIAFFQAFACGAALYVLRDRIPWHWTLVLVTVAAWLGATAAVQDDIAVVAVTYATIFVAYRGPGLLRRFSSRGDFSYGIYIFAWPVGQTLASLWGPSISPIAVLAISLPVTLALAASSWFLIERPALEYKKRFAKRSVEPRVSAAPVERRPPNPTPTSAS